eukprot:SAG31_NODE_332_length_17516_cov_3.552840_13_plen_195_part_00
MQLTGKRLRSILADICAGMSYLHNWRDRNGLRLPILHRDLKPANLLVTRHLTVKIADFGLSMQRSGSTKSAGIGAVDQSTGGTAPYSAPEVLLGKPLLGSGACDIFSFGVIVWELYCRRRPWGGAHEARIIQLVGMDDKRLEIPEDLAEQFNPGEGASSFSRQKPYETVGGRVQSMSGNGCPCLFSCHPMLTPG